MANLENNEPDGPSFFLLAYPIRLTVDRIRVVVVGALHKAGLSGPPGPGLTNLTFEDFQKSLNEPDDVFKDQ
jgi:hypothetical protein